MKTTEGMTPEETICQLADWIREGRRGDIQSLYDKACYGWVPWSNANPLDEKTEFRLKPRKPRIPRTGYLTFPGEAYPIPVMEITKEVRERCKDLPLPFHTQLVPPTSDAYSGHWYVWL